VSEKLKNTNNTKIILFFIIAPFVLIPPNKATKMPKVTLLNSCNDEQNILISECHLYFSEYKLNIPKLVAKPLI